jgi:hypothetical protein
MTEPTSARLTAQTTLNQFAATLNTLPTGYVQTDSLHAVAAKAHAVATAAVAAALLDIADAIRENNQ